MIFAGTTMGADLRFLFPSLAPVAGSFAALSGGSFQYSYTGSAINRVVYGGTDLILGPSGPISGTVTSIQLFSVFLPSNAGTMTGSFDVAAAFGPNAASLIFGGNDTLTGGTGNDFIHGYDGDDYLDGGRGGDTLMGGTGQNLLVGDFGVNVASYADATRGVTVSLDVSGPQDTGVSRDTLSSIRGLIGSDFADTLTGSVSGSTLHGGGGDDRLTGSGSFDVLMGGAGADVMDGGLGDDQYQIDDLGDVVLDAGGQDVAWHLNDDLPVAASIEIHRLAGLAVRLAGGAGDDLFSANAARGSTLSGEGGHDTLWGEAGADTLLGGDGWDVLRGAGGNDLLAGNAGNDKLVGGAGADRFVFDQARWGYDEIFDFSAGQGDKLDMRGSGATEFGQLTIQVIGGNTRVFGPEAPVWNFTQTIDVYGVTNLGAADFLF